MTKNFDAMNKNVGKIMKHLSAISFSATVVDMQPDFAAVLTATQGYKELFDYFGKAVVATGTTPVAADYMSTIAAKLSSMVGINGIYNNQEHSRNSLYSKLQNIDKAFGTTLATLAPSAEEQSKFATMIDTLFAELLKLTRYGKITDAQLIEGLKNYDLVTLLLYFANWQNMIVTMSTQITFIEAQYQSVEDFQTAAKKSMATFTKDLPKMIKAMKDNKDKGKVSWVDALNKLQAASKKSAETIQMLLRANTDIDQSSSAYSVATQIDLFFNKFIASDVTTNKVFMAKLLAAFNFADDIEGVFTDVEVGLIRGQVTSIASILFRNLDGSGQSCLKNITSQITGVLSVYQTDQYTCMEDMTTYVPFSTEFIKMQMGLLKCQTDTVINYLPTCLKQISKKTSNYYADSMFNDCMTKYAEKLVNGYNTGIKLTIDGMADQVTSDFDYLQEQYYDCLYDADIKLTRALKKLVGIFTACSPPKVALAPCAAGTTFCGDRCIPNDSVRNCFDICVSDCSECLAFPVRCGTDNFCNVLEAHCNMQ